jgi:hypothetical protein
MSSYLRCSVGVPGLAVCVGEWVCVGLRGAFAFHVCSYDCMGRSPGGLVSGQ